MNTWTTSKVVQDFVRIPGGLRLCRNQHTIHPFCVGRRGWLFSDTVDGANASANLYSLVETCKANGIDPYRYLTWLFQRLPLAKRVDDYDALLPWKMPVD